MPLSRRQVHEIRMKTILMLKIPRQILQQRFNDEGIDLTMLQYGIMNMARMEKMTMADLSRKMGLDPSTLVASVDALVKKNYLKRERDPEDRRRYPLHVTETGTALLKHIEVTFGSDPLPAALEQLEADELEQLQYLLGKVVSFLPEGDAALEEIETHLQMMESQDDCNEA